MLERKIIALQLLLGAKNLLDMDNAAFATWLIDQAQEIAPQLFEDGEAAQDDEPETTEAASGRLN